jgi:hypothetical protein
MRGRDATDDTAGSIPAVGEPGVHLAEIVAADVYQARTESRPPRPARTQEAAASELRREVRAGRLDGEAVAALHTAAEEIPRRAVDLRPRGVRVEDTVNGAWYCRASNVV